MKLKKKNMEAIIAKVILDYYGSEENIPVKFQFRNYSKPCFKLSNIQDKEERKKQLDILIENVKKQITEYETTYSI